MDPTIYVVWLDEMKGSAELIDWIATLTYFKGYKPYIIPESCEVDETEKWWKSDRQSRKRWFIYLTRGVAGGYGGFTLQVKKYQINFPKSRTSERSKSKDKRRQRIFGKNFQKRWFVTDLDKRFERKKNTNYCQKVIASYSPKIPRHKSCVPERKRISWRFIFTAFSLKK